MKVFLWVVLFLTMMIFSSCNVVKTITDEETEVSEDMYGPNPEDYTGDTGDTGNTTPDGTNTTGAPLSDTSRLLFYPCYYITDSNSETICISNFIGESYTIPPVEETSQLIETMTSVRQLTLWGGAIFFLASDMDTGYSHLWRLDLNNEFSFYKYSNVQFLDSSFYYIDPSYSKLLMISQAGELCSLTDPSNTSFTCTSGANLYPSWINASSSGSFYNCDVNGYVRNFSPSTGIPSAASTGLTCSSVFPLFISGDNILGEEVVTGSGATLDSFNGSTMSTWTLNSASRQLLYSNTTHFYVSELNVSNQYILTKYSIVDGTSAGTEYTSTVGATPLSGGDDFIVNEVSEGPIYIFDKLYTPFGTGAYSLPGPYSDIGLKVINGEIFLYQNANIYILNQGTSSFDQLLNGVLPPSMDTLESGMYFDLIYLNSKK